jgi:hypothetical protein
VSGAPVPEGDPACWAHLVDGEKVDLATRGEVEHLVRTFYRAAAMDDVLGPVFEAAHVDWPSHIETVTALYEGPVADLAKARAEKMARALRRLLRGESAPGDAPVEVARPRRADDRR